MFRLLPRDKLWIEVRIEELQTQIKDLGPEFHEVLNQSSETWHDNAPFDAVRDKQSLLYAEYSHLKYILLNSEPIKKPAEISAVLIGHKISISKNGKTRSYFVAGDWSHNVSQDFDGAIVVTAQSPLAKAILGKTIGEETVFGTVSAIESASSRLI